MSAVCPAGHTSASDDYCDVCGMPIDASAVTPTAAPAPVDVPAQASGTQPCPNCSTPNAPDALFCDNDQLARGASEALRDRGIDIPRQVAIVGFDNWEVMTLAAQPQLSSIDLNLSELGHEAGEALLKVIGGERLAGVRRLPCSLIVRESSKI